MNRKNTHKNLQFGHSMSGNLTVLVYNVSSTLCIMECFDISAMVVDSSLHDEPLSYTRARIQN